ncbi:hypothetical protein GA0115256_13754 [Streptomyces sp. DconLS]|nr:hypothetical protein GA0115256_13754 [Streptomyces sp. DconLS]
MAGLISGPLRGLVSARLPAQHAVVDRAGPVLGFLAHEKTPAGADPALVTDPLGGPPRCEGGVDDHPLAGALAVLPADAGVFQ